MVRDVTEGELIARAREGDPRALEALVRLWGPRVRRFATRLCPVTEALDAAQESLFILTSQVTSLRSAEAVVSWTFQIVKRQCVKIFARTRRDTALARELGFRAPEESSPVDREGWLLALGREVANLPERDRQVLVLRDFEQLTARETAERLALSEVAVKSRLHRARVLLRERLLALPEAKTLSDW